MSILDYERILVIVKSSSKFTISREKLVVYYVGWVQV